MRICAGFAATGGPTLGRKERTHGAAVVVVTCHVPNHLHNIVAQLK